MSDSPAPLALVAGCLARLVGPFSALNGQDLSGRLGRAIRYDAEAMEWVVRLLESEEQLQCKPEALAAHLAVGCGVEISGIESRTELNGQLGRVCDYDDAVGRWIVELPGTKERVRCKMERLVPRSALALSDGCMAEIVGLKSRDELNGKLARVIMYEDSVGRWVVQPLNSQEQIRCKPECLVAQLAAGCIAELTGLQSRAELNGKAAKVCAYDKDADRWTVELEETAERLRCKTECLKGPVRKAGEEEKKRKAAVAEAASARRKADEAKAAEARQKAEAARKAAQEAASKEALRAAPKKAQAEAKQKASPANVRSVASAKSTPKSSPKSTPKSSPKEQPKKKARN